MINFNQLVFFAPLLRLRLPRLAYSLFRSLSFAVGDIYALQLIFQLSLASLLPASNSGPFSPAFALYGKSVLLIF